jgi:hypothetical protein
MALMSFHVVKPLSISAFSRLAPPAKGWFWQKSKTHLGRIEMDDVDTNCVELIVG